MKDLLGYGVLAFWAGVLLNFVPCVLPVIPLKIRAVLRETYQYHKEKGGACLQ